jgi:hypothetical protein
MRILLLLSVKPTRDVSGRSRPRRAGFPTGTRRYWSSEEADSLLWQRACAYRKRHAFTKTLIIFWSTFWALSFINLNTWQLIYNNFKLNFIFGIVCLCVCLRILASSRIPQYDLGRQTPHFWGGSVTISHKNIVCFSNETPLIFVKLVIKPSARYFCMCVWHYKIVIWYNVSAYPIFAHMSCIILQLTRLTKWCWLMHLFSILLGR